MGVKMDMYSVSNDVSSVFFALLHFVPFFLGTCAIHFNLICGVSFHADFAYCLLAIFTMFDVFSTMLPDTAVMQAGAI